MKIIAPTFLVGATGAGKSAAAMELARDWTRSHSGEAAILCLDAMQVYRGADIGTGKPTAAERAEVPHGGLDVVEFGASFDVAQYLKHAEEFLREQREAGRRVIVVGGTGLYFRALTRGLCEAPQGSDELRAELSSLPVEELRVRLKQVDPAMLKKIDASNPRRLVRAIEVMEETGRSLREWQDATPEPLVPDFTALWIQREPEDLARRIEERVAVMFDQGWVQEVRGLVERYGFEAVKRFPGIGYRDIAHALPELAARPATVASLKSDICVATRQYAKRQLTWFAREPNVVPVMLTGHPSLSAALSAAGIIALS